MKYKNSHIKVKIDLMNNTQKNLNTNKYNCKYNLSLTQNTDSLQSSLHKLKTFFIEWHGVSQSQSVVYGHLNKKQ